VADVNPPEPATISSLTAEEIFDLLASRVACDPANPGWTPELVRQHRHSLEKRLVILPGPFPPGDLEAELAVRGVAMIVHEP